MSVPNLWSAVREARPRLAPHARAHQRDVRGEPWTILHNDVNGEQVRLNGPASAVVLALDGERSVAATLEATVPGADAALREALAGCLTTLEASGLLRLGRADDTERLVTRAARARARRRFDPLALRIPLLDPDPWLERLAPAVARLAGRTLAVATLALFALAVTCAVAESTALSAELARIAAAPTSWWRYALLYPLLKLVHELAHAVTVKHHGGAVHAAGLTLLVLMPIPYVDASDSARFARRGPRLAVGAAGLLAEGAVAAAGLLLWSVTEAGVVHDAAFAAALLGSVSTLVFNANPLLRFDGYHLLQDLLDMPNLGTRASAALGWLLRRHALGARVGRPPVTGPREWRWLIGYGLASLAYRWVLTLSIALYLAGTVPLVGVALALFALHRLLLRPLVRGVRYVASSPELAGHRGRSASVSLGGTFALALAVALVPLPSSTRAEGVVRASTQATLYAAAEGEIADVLVAPGAFVRTGEPVLRLAAPELHARHAVLAAETHVLVTRRHALLASDPVAAATLAREIDELEIRAGQDGRFAPVEGRLARGRAVRRGEVLGHLVGDAALHVETVIEQHRIGRVREGVRAVRVRLAERVDRVLSARLVGDRPAADRRLPSAALAFDGTRGIAVASADEELRTVEPVFHLELGLPADIAAAGIGGRAYVTLVHDAESLGRRGWRAARQLFLETLAF